MQYWDLIYKQDFVRKFVNKLIQFNFSRNMPDIDTLMQEWPPEFEELLKEVRTQVTLKMNNLLFIDILKLNFSKKGLTENERNYGDHFLRMNSLT